MDKHQPNLGFLSSVNGSALACPSRSDQPMSKVRLVRPVPRREPRTITSLYRKVVDQRPLNCLVYMEQTLARPVHRMGVGKLPTSGPLRGPVDDPRPQTLCLNTRGIEPKSCCSGREIWSRQKMSKSDTFYSEEPLICGVCNSGTTGPNMSCQQHKTCKPLQVSLAKTSSSTQLTKTPGPDLARATGIGGDEGIRTLDLCSAIAVSANGGKPT